MNTYTFDITKVETHDFDIVMGQNISSYITIDSSRTFYLAIDGFQESTSFVVKFINPIRIKIIELKQTLLPTANIKVLNRVSLNTKLIEYSSPIIRIANRIVASPNLYQNENVIIRTPNAILAFARMILKIYDAKIVIANRIVVTPVLKRYKFLSEFDPQLLTDLDGLLLQDMDYEVL